MGKLLTSLSIVRNIWLMTLSKKKVMASHCAYDDEKIEQRPPSPVPAVGHTWERRMQTLVSVGG